MCNEHKILFSASYLCVVVCLRKFKMMKILDFDTETGVNVERMETDGSSSIS